MKKIFYFLCFACVAAFMASCGPKGEEESKSIAAKEVDFDGEVLDVFDIIDDSVKVLLTKENTDGTKWNVKLVVNLGANRSWNDIMKEYPCKFDGEAYINGCFYGKGINFREKVFLDANGTALDNSVSCETSFSIELDEKNEEKVVFCLLWSTDYEEAKGLFDKVAGAKFSYELTKYYHSDPSSSSSSSSSSYDDDDDDLGAAYEALEAAEAAAAAMSSATSYRDAQKALKEYEKAAKALENL